jgi:hypothetical protein
MNHGPHDSTDMPLIEARLQRQRERMLKYNMRKWQNERRAIEEHDPYSNTMPLDNVSTFDGDIYE